MKYLKRFIKWLFSFWLLDEKENKIEEIKETDFKNDGYIKYHARPEAPEVFIKESGNRPKQFGEYFLKHKMPKYLKKKK